MKTDEGTRRDGVGLIRFNKLLNQLRLFNALAIELDQLIE